MCVCVYIYMTYHLGYLSIAFLKGFVVAFLKEMALFLI